MTTESQTPQAPCDCLNFCGDDPWIAQGKSKPCEELAKLKTQCQAQAMAKASIQGLPSNNYTLFTPHGGMMTSPDPMEIVQCLLVLVKQTHPAFNHQSLKPAGSEQAAEIKASVEKLSEAILAKYPELDINSLVVESEHAQKNLQQAELLAAAIGEGGAV